MRRFLSAIGVVLVSCAVTGEAWASQNTGFATVGAGSNIVYINIEGATNMPSCARFGRYAADVRTDAGRSIYALALSANLAGKKLTVLGRGTCDFLPNDAEDINMALWYFPECKIAVISTSYAYMSMS